MKFVTGGCYQGKQQWVLTHEKLLQSQIADGAVCSAKEIKDAKALDHFHLLVQRWMLADKNPWIQRNGNGGRFTAESAVSWPKGPIVLSV